MRRHLLAARAINACPLIFALASSDTKPLSTPPHPQSPPLYPLHTPDTHPRQLFYLLPQSPVLSDLPPQIMPPKIRVPNISFRKSAKKAIKAFFDVSACHASL